MVKILFICHGNICRSPIAEFVLKDKVAKLGIADQFTIASCATSTEEIWGDIGNPVYPPAREELARHGIDCAGKHAVQLQKSDYDQYDYLLCMDSMNVRNALRILKSDPEHKLMRLLKFSEDQRDISDPWYTRDFGKAYRDIEEGCDGLLQYLGY